MCVCVCPNYVYRSKDSEELFPSNESYVIHHHV